MASGPVTSGQIDGETGNSDTLFSWVQKSLQMVIAAMKLKDACPLEENYDKPRQHVKIKRHHFAYKDMHSQSCVFCFFCLFFSSSHVWMWELDHREGWGLKNWCFQTVVLEKFLENPLDSKEIKSKPVILKEINLNIHWKDWCWSSSSSMMWRANSLERPWCWERLRAGGEGGNR